MSANAYRLLLLQLDDRVDAFLAVVDRDLNDRVRLLDRGAGPLGFLQRLVGRLRLPVDLQLVLPGIRPLALFEVLGGSRLFGLGDLADDLGGLLAKRHDVVPLVAEMDLGIGWDFDQAPAMPAARRRQRRRLRINPPPVWHISP